MNYEERRYFFVPFHFFPFVGAIMMNVSSSPGKKKPFAILFLRIINTCGAFRLPDRRFKLAKDSPRIQTCRNMCPTTSWGHN